MARSRRPPSVTYCSRRGSVEQARERAAALVGAMGRVRCWTTSSLYTHIDADTLLPPSGGYGFGASALLGRATFEQAVLLLGLTDVVLLVWEDED